MLAVLYNALSMKITSDDMAKTLHFKFRRHHVQVILDSVLIFRAMRKLHGRFWGAAGVNIMVLILAVSYLIRPDLLQQNEPISALGTDVRTAPYFAGAMFFASYGLWRWRRYLVSTLKRPRPLTWLVLMTILGLYIVALVPVSWETVGYWVHTFGMALVGLSALATVVIDILLTKTHASAQAAWWRLLRFASVALITVGGYVTLGSIRSIDWFHSGLTGEAMMIAGYSLWIYLKTYQGEGGRSRLSRVLKKVVLVD